MSKWKQSLNVFLATSLVASAVAPVAPAVVSAEAPAVAADLIISEYVEGVVITKRLSFTMGLVKQSIYQTINLNYIQMEVHHQIILKI